MPVPSQGHYVFTVFRFLTDFVCLYNYEFWLSLCKIVRRSLILLLLLFVIDSSWKKLCITTKVNPPTTQMTLVDVGYFLTFCLLASTVFWFIWFSIFFYYERFWTCDDGYSRNASCTLYWISTFSFKNWMHFVLVLLACKSVDRSTFCMKHAFTRL